MATWNRQVQPIQETTYHLYHVGASTQATQEVNPCVKAAGLSMSRFSLAQVRLQPLEKCDQHGCCLRQCAVLVQHV